MFGAEAGAASLLRVSGQTGKAGRGEPAGCSHRRNSRLESWKRGALESERRMRGLKTAGGRDLAGAPSRAVTGSLWVRCVHGLRRSQAGRKRPLDNQPQGTEPGRGCGRLIGCSRSPGQSGALFWASVSHSATQTDVTITQSPPSLVLGWVGGQWGDQEPGRLPGARACCRHNAQKRVAGHPHLCPSLKLRAAWGPCPGRGGGHLLPEAQNTETPSMLRKCQIQSGTRLILLRLIYRSHAIPIKLLAGFFSFW